MNIIKKILKAILDFNSSDGALWSLRLRFST
ncbi:hypothetical protein CG98_gp151 [Enterobacter phage PG7]|uniref:Uncharacterized protein n=1 Tax=Enterobacter phage PG7 TaxID=1455074 RepID=W6AUT9_9CAUD|nr:hypothetical protein CG98_gp151 [Enterobacter phage PG7]AHI61194.1 hypothetical protein PG7_291 [Enterobacter phage PG7]